MVNCWRQLIAKVREEIFILLAEIAALKKVTQLLQKGYHKCALLFS